MKKYILPARICATIMALSFLLASCANSIGDGATSTDAANVGSSTSTTTPASSKSADGLLIEFTGNPAYDITLLNAYWAKNGTPFPAPKSAAQASKASENTTSNSVISNNIPSPLYAVDSSAAINGFGDLVKNFSGTGLLTWASGAALSGGISASVGIALPMVLDALGIVKSTASYLAEISAKLDAIQNQLNTMQTMLEELGEQVERVNTEVQYQGTLTRYYSVMQNRDNQYNNIYIDAMTCWNSLIDVLLKHALESQYPKDATGKAAKLAELTTKEKRLAYIKSFIDTDSWEKATSADQVAVANTEAGKAFQTYFKAHEKEIAADLAAIVKKWGANSNTGASGVFKLCKYLTDTSKGTAKESFNMFQLYDKYAEVSFVWEQEGYTFRQQMRDQDSALIAMTATLAYWYYAITETLGSNSSNCLDLENYVNAALKLNKACSVVRHSTPIYQKWGSKWRGQVFTGTLTQIDYCNVLNNLWRMPKNSETATRPRYDDIRVYALTDKVIASSYGSFKNNASRFYLGLGPRETLASDQNAIEKEAMERYMPEEWFKEMFDAYAGKSGNEKAHLSILEIFNNIGFTGVMPFSHDLCFITDYRHYSRLGDVNKKNDYICNIYITAVNGSSDSTCVYKDHEVVAANFYGGNGNASLMYCYKTSYRELANAPVFYYPVKANKAVVAQ